MSKVVKVVKKIAPFALGIAAAYFTFGGSLAIGGLNLAGGWASAIGTVIESLGIAGSTLGNILGGAVQYAGWGALGGAAVAAATGGDIGEGAAQGALYGGLTGGAMGGLGLIPPPGASAAGGKSLVSQANGVPIPPEGGRAAAQAALGGGASPVGGGSFLDQLFSEGGWLERNAGLVGPTIAGIGTGLVEGLSSRDQIESEERLQRQRQHTLPSIWSPVTDNRGLMLRGNVY